MRVKKYALSCLLVYFMAFATSTLTAKDNETWSEEKVGRLAVKADQAATKGKWRRAIKFGEKALAASSSLYEESDENYLRRLKTLNGYYDKAGRLKKIPERVQKAYHLSHQNLGISHRITRANRLLFYKLLIAQENYIQAIPLVEESISLLSESEDDKFLKLRYLEQLFSLYGLNKQYKKEEETLHTMLALNMELMGSAIEDNLDIILILASTYCKQNEMDKFTNLMQQYSLRYVC